MRAVQKIYGRINDVLHQHGFALVEDSFGKKHICHLNGSPVYVDIEISDVADGIICTNDEKAEMRCFGHLDVAGVFAPTEQKSARAELDFSGLYTAAEQMTLLAHALKTLKDVNLSYVMTLDGDEVDGCCGECLYWKDVSDNDYGTCTCRYSSVYGMWVSGSHVCSARMPVKGSPKEE